LNLTATRVELNVCR